MVLVEQEYKELRRKLDDMGYHHTCSVDSMLLVDRLLNEIISTRNRLSLNDEIADNAIKRYEDAERSAEILKKGNTRLIKENNRMHMELIKSKEDSEKTIKQLKSRIIELENMYSDLEFNYMELITNSNMKRQGKMDEENLAITGQVIKENFVCSECKAFDRVDDGQETSKFVTKQHLLLDELEILKSQLLSRDREITRLTKELEESYSIQPVLRQKKCSCHVADSAQSSRNAMYEEKIRAAQNKQHEAMERALTLADRIQQLESELHQQKHMTRLENQCACEKNLAFLREQHTETLNKIKDMEERITNLQSLVQDLTKETEEGNNRIVGLVTENNSLNDKLKTLKSIENDLMSEIDRLQKINAELTDEVARLFDRNDNLQEMLKKSNQTTTETNRAKTETEKVDGGQLDNKRDEKLCDKMKAERDYYCNELHRLQEKIYNGERLLKCNELSGNTSVNPMLMKKLKSELYHSRKEIERNKDEMLAMRNQLEEFSSYKSDANKLVENHMKKLECDKAALVTANSDMRNKLLVAEQKLDQLTKMNSQLIEQLENYKVKYGYLKKLNTQLDLSLKNREAMRKKNEADLRNCTVTINQLEKELELAKDEILVMSKEKQGVKENLLKLDGEKDQLLLKLDDKAVMASKLDRDLKNKNAQMLNIEKKKSELQSQLKMVEKLLHEAEDKCKIYSRDNRRLEQELITLHSSKDSLQLEYESLKRESEATIQDMILTKRALEESRLESENLKRELQTYVDEVRRVEKILLEKERERELLLDQFNALSAEASHMETNQQSLEYEANISKDSLRDTTKKISTLQRDANAKDSMLSTMKYQMQQLSDQVIQLQAQITAMNNREVLLTNDLEAARKLCSTLEHQKQYYTKELSQMESSETILRDELNRLEYENKTLHNQMVGEHQSSSSLEKMLSKSRQEAMEKCFYNEDLTKEVNKMKNTIATLESRLNSVKSSLSECQSACADYHSQNEHLKRQITNEKFEHARDIDSNSTSL